MEMEDNVAKGKFLAMVVFLDLVTSGFVWFVSMHHHSRIVRKVYGVSLYISPADKISSARFCKAVLWALPTALLQRHMHLASLSSFCLSLCLHVYLSHQDMSVCLFLLLIIFLFLALVSQVIVS